MGRRARTGPSLAAGELRDADPACGRERPPRAAVRARIGIRPGRAGRRRGVVQQLLLFARPVRRPAGRPRGDGRRRLRRHGLAVERAVQAAPEAAGRALHPRRGPACAVGRRMPVPRVPQPRVEAVLRARQGDLRAAAAAPEARGRTAFAARHGRGRALDLCERDQPDADRHDHARSPRPDASGKAMPPALTTRASTGPPRPPAPAIARSRAG
ncbi:hypothetical protein BPA30113_00655 [Burkholderia paludis]|uniref:Uncharacterized protein n=1 Tax=Burkholderia paludis TaxID=1506587 RepID=A0A6P2HQG1_9BURK|nr:hypothetical protein LMG30113_00839 [Burkholderia paludis]VWB20212.1 hypothetical protein BPA30113_00655 [Burkholderia paludis]